jgi:hypothetical protein
MFLGHFYTEFAEWSQVKITNAQIRSLQNAFGCLTQLNEPRQAIKLSVLFQFVDVVTRQQHLVSVAFRTSRNLPRLQVVKYIVENLPVTIWYLQRLRGVVVGIGPSSRQNCVEVRVSVFDLMGRFQQHRMRNSIGESAHDKVDKRIVLLFTSNNRFLHLVVFAVFFNLKFSCSRHVSLSIECTKCK